MRNLILAGPVVLALACTTNPDTPTATGPSTQRSAASSLPPFAVGVHVAALPGLDDPRLLLADMNGFGEIVGVYIPASGPEQAFKYQTTRGLTLLTLPTGESTEGVSVNDDGQVAVLVNPTTRDTVPFARRAAIWDWFGNVKNLPLLSSYHASNFTPFCNVVRITNGGTTAGTCTVDGQPGELLTVWTQFGSPWWLGFNGHLNAFSDSGYAAGSEPTPDSTAFVLTPAHQLQVLQKVTVNGVPVFQTVAEAVNNHGQAAGSGGTPGASLCPSYAAAWLSGTTITLLGYCGQANGITDDAVVIGTEFSGSLSPQTWAVMWTAATGLQRLPGLEGGAALEMESSSALRINSHHQILGTVTTSDGVQHKVIWTLP